MQKIEGLQKLELEKLLKDLNTYKYLTKKVWKRWKIIFDNIFNGKNDYKVEYYKDIEKSFVLEQAVSIYKKVFNINVLENDIKLVENKNIKWWIKVFLNDNLVDMSFSKFYKLLK